MKNGKSPGNDGLMKGFYVCFFEEINQFLIEALNESFNIGQLSTSHHYIFVISQLRLTSHPRSTVVILDTETPGTSSFCVQ